MDTVGRRLTTKVAEDTEEKEEKEEKEDDAATLSISSEFLYVRGGHSSLPSAVPNRRGVPTPARSARRLLCGYIRRHLAH